jgi:hypothetical protein
MGWRFEARILFREKQERLNFGKILKSARFLGPGIEKFVNVLLTFNHDGDDPI